MTISYKIKSLFGLNMVGKLKSYERQYKKSKRYIFDSTNIYCGTTEWTSPKKSYSVWATTYCNDPNVGGIDISNNFHFWQTANFISFEEAVSFLEKEIIIAAKKYPATKFYIIQENHCEKYFLNGKWNKCEGIPHIRYCHACGTCLTETDTTICHECGEPLVFN